MRAMTLLGSPASTFFEGTMSAVNYQLVLLLFQLRLCLRFLLSFLAAKLSSWTCEGYLVGKRKGVHTEVPALCRAGKTKGTSVVAFSFQDPLSNGGRGCWHTTRRQNSVQVSTILEVLCMLLESLNECHLRCGEKLKWKLLHQNISFGGGDCWKKS